MALAESTPPQISYDEFSKQIKDAVAQHEDEVLSILGQERLDKAKQFRENFNREVFDKFGTFIWFTGF